MRTRASLKELAVNVTKALSKKLDRSDLRKVLKEKEEEDAKARRSRAAARGDNNKYDSSEERSDDGDDAQGRARNDLRRSDGWKGAGSRGNSKRRSEFDSILAQWRQEDHAEGDDQGRPTSSSSSSAGSMSRSRHQNNQNDSRDAAHRRSQSGSPANRGNRRGAHHPDNSNKYSTISNNNNSLSEVLTAELASLRGYLLAVNQVI